MLQNLQFPNSSEKRFSYANASFIFLQCDFVKLQNYEEFGVAWEALICQLEPVLAFLLILEVRFHWSEKRMTVHYLNYK